MAEPIFLGVVAAWAACFVVNLWATRRYYSNPTDVQTSQFFFWATDGSDLRRFLLSPFVLSRALYFVLRAKPHERISKPEARRRLDLDFSRFGGEDSMKPGLHDYSVAEARDMFAWGDDKTPTRAEPQ